MSAQAFDRFYAGATRVRSPDLVPEISLRLADDLPTLWRDHEAWMGRLGASAPYWGIAWPGGQVLARYLLDHSGLVKGRTVLDIGSGSGICAIAAALAGAGEVVAADIDPYARLAVAGNARRNGVAVTTQARDPIGSAGNWDIILAADLWYERFLAQRLTAWLAEAAHGGTVVYLADPGRAHFPRQGLEEVASHRLQFDTGLEPADTTHARVWRFSP